MMDTPFGSFDLSGGDDASGVRLDAVAGNTVTPFGAFGLGNDMAEAAQLQPFVPPVAQAQGMAWWESLIAYGATRAIDNKFGPIPVQGNTNPGNFAGQNGRTYANNPTAAGGNVQSRTGQQSTQQAQGLGQLAALAALAFAFF